METSLLGFIKAADYAPVSYRTQDQFNAIEKTIALRDKYLDNPTDKNKAKLIEALKIAEKLHPFTGTSGFMSFVRDDMNDANEMWERGNKLRSIIPASHLLLSTPFSLITEPIRYIGRAVHPKFTFTYKDTKDLENELDPKTVEKIVNEHIDDLDLERADPARTLLNPSISDILATGLGMGGAIMGNPFKLIPAAIRGGSLTANTIGDLIGANGIDRETYAAMKSGSDIDPAEKKVKTKKKKEDYVDQIRRLAK